MFTIAKNYDKHFINMITIVMENRPKRVGGAGKMREVNRTSARS